MNKEKTMKYLEEKYNLSWADLRETDLSLADLSDADLREADLYRANLRGAKGILIAQFDDRGYTLIMYRADKQLYFKAGCQHFIYEEALAHWGGLDYPNQERGKVYCQFVKFLHIQRKLI